MPIELYQKLKQALKYDYGKDVDDLNSYMLDLPYNLKIDLSLYLYSHKYKHIQFFKYKNKSFITWIFPLLRPFTATEHQYVFFEGDNVDGIYFMKEGSCGFVLPKHENIKYINIDLGTHFGVIDIVGTLLKGNQGHTEDLSAVLDSKKKIIRQFTVMAEKESEILMLHLKDLNRMKLEFHESFLSIMKDGNERL